MKVTGRCVEEVEEAIFQMHPLNSLGPDGLRALFYQKYWHIIGGDVQHHALDVPKNIRHL